MSYPLHCPKCNADLRGEPIPEKDREMFGGHTHFLKVISIYNRDRDRTVKWKCPDCGHEWDV